MASHVKHYQWSFIGNLLNQMPDEMFQSIRTDDRVYEIYDLEKLTDGALFQKHDTGFVWRWMMEHDTEFFQNGKMDDFAKTVGVVIRIRKYKGIWKESMQVLYRYISKWRPYRNGNLGFH